MGSRRDPLQATLRGWLTKQHWEGLFTGSGDRLSSEARLQILGDFQQGEIPVQKALLPPSPLLPHSPTPSPYCPKEEESEQELKMQEPRPPVRIRVHGWA